MKKLAAVLFSLATGCTDGTDTSFHVAGHVAGTVTHVIATTPSRIATSRIAVAVAADGSFEVALAPGHPWLLAFADANQVGADMLVATFQAGSLDVLAPQAAGSLDLGGIELQGGHATSAMPRADLLRALGLDATAAARLGAIDDLATRYANPDVDGDGVIDALEQDRDFHVNVSGDLRLTTATGDFQIADLVTGTTVGVHYLGTAIEVGVPRAMAPTTMAGSTMTFEQTYFGTAYGPDTWPIAAGTPIPQPYVMIGEANDQPIAAVYARPGHDAPSGKFEIAVGANTLTFTNVQTPPDAALGAGEPFAVPLVRLVPIEGGCTVDCPIASIDYQWMHQTADGWLAAAPIELAAAHIDIVSRTPSGNQYLRFDLPADQLATSLAVPTGLDTGEICYFAVTFDNAIGLRMTSIVTNPAAICAGAY